ncbi:uncharacterized protein LOC135383492 isoform X2 [Ornithodoros turicata]|uniref:uncharacterized protein LOC135383492 isoform X2 n=1 Tax=Ornithodoros turicata TaxID=34597 RepID=UPI00313A1923
MVRGEKLELMDESGAAGSLKEMKEGSVNVQPTMVWRIVTTASKGGSNTTQKPMTRKPLVCSMGAYNVTLAQLPEDGLCEFLFLESIEMDSSNSLDVPHWFRVRAKAANKTAFGLSLRHGLAGHTNLGLQTNNGQASFWNLWEDSIQHYAVLRVYIGNNVTNSNVGDIINLLTTIKWLQDNARVDDPEELGYIFLGVTIVSRGDDDKKRNVLDLFNVIINESPLDALVLQPQYYADHSAEPNCRVTGHSHWEGYFYSDQPTYVEMLDFLRTATFPRHLVLVLSVSRAALLHGTLGEGSFSGFEADGERCVKRNPGESFIAPPSKLCSVPEYSPGATFMSAQSLQMYSFVPARRWLFVFDNHDTVKRKMCRVHRSYPHWTFGWAMSEVELSEDSNACTSSHNRTRFSLLRTLKRYINMTIFNEGDVC